MSHNKKRNAGIIYELLVRAVSAYLVENDKAKAQVALNILSTHFNKKTELYKEFRIFHALTKSTVQDSSIAASASRGGSNPARISGAKNTGKLARRNRAQRTCRFHT